jgi:carboxyl-terminal processing protease
MDTTASEDRPVNSPFGAVKITVGKLYRLNGTTAQLHGVQPDVRLPDAFDNADAREKNYPFALPADTIKRNTYYKPLASLPVSDLAAASAARVNGSEAFQAIRTGIQKMAAFVQNKNSAIPLKIDAYEKWRIQNEELMKGGSSENEKASTHFAVANHQYEDRRLQTNGYAAEINRYFIEMIKKDVYLEEAFRVVADLIQKTSIK